MKKRFTCHDIGEMYGVHVQTVWAWVRRGQLGAVRIGGTYYIRQSDIDEMENRLAVRPSAKEAAVDLVVATERCEAEGNRKK